MLTKASVSDIDWIVSAQTSMAKETEGLELDEPTVRRGVAGVFERPQRGTYWLWKQDEQVSACLLCVDEWSDWRAGTVWWIHSVYVSPEFRRTGIYKNMYRALQDMVAANEGVKGIRLYVDKTNTKAQSVYEACGMSNEHYSLYEWLP